MHENVGMWTYEVAPVLIKVPEALTRLSDYGKMKETAYSLSNDTNLPMYQLWQTSRSVLADLVRLRRSTKASSYQK